MLANAIACGNTFVLKPSEKDPSASLILADMVQRAGFPDGVVNVVQGDSEAVDALLTHPAIEAVSFVGSTGVAAPRVRDGDPSRQAGTSARRRQEPHGRAPGRRPRAARGRGDIGRLRVGGRAVHGHLHAGGGRLGRGRSGRRDRLAHTRCGGRSRRRPGLDDGATDHVRAPRSSARLRGARRGRRGAGRRRRVGRPPPGRLLPGLLAPRRREARDAGLRRRDLRPGAGSRPGSEPRRRASRW